MLSQITGALLIILETSSMDSTGISLETTLGPRNNDHHILKDPHTREWHGHIYTTKCKTDR